MQWRRRLELAGGAMPSVRRSLIIPAETQNREFDAKLLLACFAAERGFAAVVGSKKEINLRLGSLPRSIFLSKSLTNRNLRLYEILENLGHPLVCGDEEGLIYFSPESYLKSKVGDAAFRKAAALLAWGPENARIWRGYSRYHGAPIHVTGNPRVDLLRPELRPFFGAPAERLRERFGRFLLINTNFGRLNHYYPRLSWQRRTLEEAARAPGSRSEFDVGLAKHREALFRHFLKMVGALARAFPEHAVVVRPHPSENHRAWREAGAGCSNVHVVHEGNAVPWLLGAEVMIHNGCTTGLESYLLGEPGIAFQPVTSERFDLHLSNGLSTQAFDLDSLRDKVAARLAGERERDPEIEAARKKLIDQHVAAVEGPFASQRIVAALEQFADGLDPADRPAPSSYLSGRAGLVVRGVQKRLEAWLPEHRNSGRYVRHMFPGIALPEVRSRIGTFQGLLDRFHGVQARQLFDNVFEVTSRGST
jgi:surface carbohydrate biosynthesis protein